MAPMDYMPGVSNATVAYATSADGSVVVGTGTSNGVPNRALRWVGNTPSDLGRLTGGNQSYGSDVSDDGSAVCGMSESASGLRAFRWTQTGGMVNLGTLAGKASSSADAMSGDGNTVVGHAYSGSTDLRAFRWNAADGIQDLGTLPGYTWLQANDATHDGSLIVGVAVASGTPRAWKWTAATGLVDLGVAPGAGGATADNVSADGRVIAGTSGEAAIWTAGMGWMTLKRILNLSGVDTSGGGSMARPECRRTG